MDGVTRTITYADAANPFNWYNGTDYTNLTWTQGRRLGSVTKGSDLYSYEYDMSGVRSVKIADGLRHEYVTQNGRVVRESVYGLNSNTGEYTVFQYALDFLYDESGHPFLMRRYYNEAQTSYNTYHYVLNAQGDVIKLLHGQNTTVAEYTYDAWGNVLTATGSLADVNPLRYRGYYFDAETGFYYLQSRYYDPVVKRFLNADSYASTGQGFIGHNMFAYCNNCPFAGSDPSGTAIHNNIVICNDGNNNPYGDRYETVPPEYEDGWYYETVGAIKAVDDYIYNDNPKNCESHFFSFYKGAPVFNIQSKLIKKLRLPSWSFGVIVLNNSAGKKTFEETLRHEYGHTVQLSNMGLLSFTAKVAIPSMAYNIASRNNDALGAIYYCMPWERTADYLGGVRGRYSDMPTSASLYNEPQWMSYCFEHFGGLR